MPVGDLGRMGACSFHAGGGPLTRCRPIDCVARSYSPPDWRAMARSRPFCRHFPAVNGYRHRRTRSRSSTSAASRSSQRSSSRTGTSRLRPRRTIRSSGASHSSKKSRETPNDSAASSMVSASRGTVPARCRIGIPSDAPKGSEPTRSRPSHPRSRGRVARSPRRATAERASERTRSAISASRRSDRATTSTRARASPCVRAGSVRLHGGSFRSARARRGRGRSLRAEPRSSRFPARPRGRAAARAEAPSAPRRSPAHAAQAPARCRRRGARCSRAPDGSRSGSRVPCPCSSASRHRA